MGKYKIIYKNGDVALKDLTPAEFTNIQKKLRKGQGEIDTISADFSHLINK